MKEQTNVIFTSKHMGLASAINIKCSRCSKVCRSVVKTSKFANCNMQGKNGQKKNISWYDLNLKLCLGTLASGLGSSNMSFFFFLGLPKAKIFHQRLFLICEFRIGASIRKIACEAMKEGRTLEVKNNQNSMEKYIMTG